MQTDKTVETHESYGMVGWSRIHGTFNDLFGTSMSHNNSVRIRIHKAEVHRKLNRDWYHTQKPVVEIELSPDQFSEFITTPNIGEGVPCTIRYQVDKGHIEGKEIESKRLQFEEEFEQSLQNIGKNFEKLTEIVDNTKITKGAREELKSAIYEVSRIINDNIPFVQTSFNKQLDKSVNEAKHAIEAFIERRRKFVDQKVLQEQNFNLLEAPKEVKISSTT